ncbi:MAG: hypothetical protein GX132_01440 [Erysipelotrichia bacterium]|jgi:hypothetical protein|nr:hypothetical protein [Erysipelotrichia bacterium]
MSIVKPGTILIDNPKEYANRVRGQAEDLYFTEAKLKRALTIKDRQQALSRFEWELDPGASGLAIGFTPLMIESMLYERGIIAGGVVEEGVLDIFTPGWECEVGVDRYGRMRGLKPMFPTAIDQDGNAKLEPFDKHFAIMYNVRSDFDQNIPYAAVLFDYTPIGSKTSIQPRLNIQMKVIEEMADLYNYSTINLVNSLGIAKYHLLDEGQRDSVEQEIRSLYAAIKRGKFYQLTSASQELQDLTTPIPYQGQAHWQSYNSLDNERLGFLGLVNQGTFQKKERKLVDETNVEASNSTLVIENSLKERQLWCDIMNHIYKVNFSVKASEEAQAADNMLDLEGGETDDNDISEV